MMKHLPLILIGTGGLGLTLLIAYNKKAGAGTSLEAKVSEKIATSNDPSVLKQLASGLQKTGNQPAAMAALQKAANITGIPITLPGLPAIQPVAATPGASSSAIGVSSYRVVSGDIPGAIAKRFGLALSTLAKANGVNSKRIMGGQIKTGEILKLPIGSVDSGRANHANGIAS
jgi:LysM repeat protein